MPFIDEQYRQRIIEFMKQRQEKGILPPIHSLGGRNYTPEQQIEEAERRTEYGEELLYMNKKLMDELNRLRKR